VISTSASFANRWQAVLGRPAPAHLPRHLLFRVIAYQLQADRFDLRQARIGLAIPGKAIGTHGYPLHSPVPFTAEDGAGSHVRDTPN
jgi:hypothetical protein